MPCLIVSANEMRAGGLERAAAEAGWKPTLRGDAKTAWEASQLWRFRLVIIDLMSADRCPQSGLWELAESLAKDRQLLLVVCGRDGHPMEEIWAHQLGVWLYLAGGGESGAATWCAEARQVAEKLFPAPAAAGEVNRRREGVRSLATDA